MLSRIYVGVDVSAKWFDVFFLGKEKSAAVRYKNNSAGHSRFVEDVRSRAKKAFICMEHTGGYETALAVACNDAKFVVSIVDGGLISTYRKSFGAAKAKTDLLDAQLLAKYCKDRKPAQWFPISDEYRILKELVKHRDDLIEHKKTASCQASHSVHSDFVAAQRAALLQVLELQIEATEEKIQEHLGACAALKSDVELLKSIPGIGFVSAVRILAETGSISNYLTAKDYALAAGLCPIVFQSGVKTSPGKLPVYGNRKLRCAFYFPAVVNFGKETGVGPFMKRVQSKANKANMTVIVAGMRKLAHIVFGVLKNRTKFDPEMT
jgi:transposase